MLLTFILFSCGSVSPDPPYSTSESRTVLPLRYTLVFVIHGDGEYGFHDNGGQAHEADERALTGAIKVALRNPHAEVLIYHRRPRGHAFFVFPLRDGDFRYYRHGKLITRESYWRDECLPHSDPETKLFDRYHRASDSLTTKFFFYFGHEIPEVGGAGYDASYPERTFTLADFSDGMARMTRHSWKFDLVVLSTCFSGTPHTIAALAPYAQTIIASPDNLHLSYLDLQPFATLEKRLQSGDVRTFARAYARQAFQRLSARVETAVTVAVYDIARVQRYINSVDTSYERTLSAFGSQFAGAIEYYDCAENPAYVLPGMSEGVHLYYRPARFGRTKNKREHSGWECSRLIQ